MHTSMSTWAWVFRPGMKTAADFTNNGTKYLVGINHKLTFQAGQQDQVAFGQSCPESGIQPFESKGIIAKIQPACIDRGDCNVPRPGPGIDEGNAGLAGSEPDGFRLQEQRITTAKPFRHFKLGCPGCNVGWRLKGYRQNPVFISHKGKIGINGQGQTSLGNTKLYQNMSFISI